MAPTSPLPGYYYAIFAFYEPALCLVGFLGALIDPQGTHDAQAPGTVPTDTLPRATYVTLMQLGHMATLLGVINFFVLSAARTYLAKHPALQERIIASLLTPLLIGDCTHLFITFWALGEDATWDCRQWPTTLWLIVVLGFSLLIPRALWHLGVGRYVDMRDGHHHHLPPRPKQQISDEKP